MIRWNLGLFAEAEAALREPAAGTDDHLIALTRSLYRTWVFIDRGALDEARELAERRIEIARSKPQAQEVIREAEGRWLLGEIAYRTGELAVAEREIAATVSSLPGLSRRLAATTLASVRLALGRSTEAVTMARELMKEVDEQGGPGHRAGRLPLLYAEALHASGDQQAARAVVAAARDDLEAKAARIDDAEVRRRFLTELPEHAQTLALADAWLTRA